MLRNLPQHELQGALVIGTFILTLGVFICVFIRALRMKKTEATHLSHLPLQDEPETHSSHD